jgi:hypothetical protein
MTACFKININPHYSTIIHTLKSHNLTYWYCRTIGHRNASLQFLILVLNLHHAGR